MKRFLILHRLMRLTLMVFLAIAFLNCSPEKFKESTDETVNITQYLRDNPEYSSFLEILEITNYASFMNTYGTYTLFLPTNAAIEEYLNDVGANSLNDVPLEDLQNLAKLHILDQKVNTTAFTDGKIATPSLQGQFLITGATNVDGVSSITVNKIAKISSSNVEVGNGVIHVIDKVLRVAEKTLAQTIEADPSLSLFTEVLKATGWYDKLNQPLVTATFEEKVTLIGHLSVIAQTNEVFAEAGFTNLQKLKDEYSHLNDPLNPQDSLNLFVSYRILPKLLYLADLAQTQSEETKAPLEVISFKLSKDTLLLNEEVFDGILEKGVAINRAKSDVTSSNGVLHYVDGNFSIKKRLPAPVYFDVCDQPEFRRLSAIFRKPGNSVSLFDADLSGMTWAGTPAVTYVAWAVGEKSGRDKAWNGDLLELYRFYDAYINKVAFTTPVIIKGKYKVWVSYRYQSVKVPKAKVLFNGLALPRLINFQTIGKTTTPSTERVAESEGYKNHITPYNSNFNSVLCGTIDVPTTGRHTITLESLNNSWGAQAWIDVIEFRPIEMDQLYPKFQAGGPGLVPQP